MNIINELNVPASGILNADIDSGRGYIFVHKPLKLDKLPIIDKSLINCKYFHLDTQNSIKQYFSRILDDTIAVRYIDNIDLMDDECSDILEINEQFCDICKSKIGINNYYSTLKSNEDNEDHDHEDEDNEDYEDEDNEDNEDYEDEDYEDEDEDNEDDVNEYCENYNVCLKCYSQSNKSMKSMKFIDQSDKENYIFNCTGMGSMLYWFPIISSNGTDWKGDIKDYKDDEDDKYNWKDNRLLINLNPDDKNYNKLCAYISGKDGDFYYIINENINIILKMLKDICDKGLSNRRNSNSSTYKSLTFNVLNCNCDSPLMVLIDNLSE